MKVLVVISVAISIVATNFLNEIHVNPAHKAIGGTVWVHGDGDHLTVVSSNQTQITAEVFCTNAIVLRWPSVAGKCYDVDWTCDFKHWTNARCWRVGTDGMIQFLTPMNLPQCFYRLRIIDCNDLTNPVVRVPMPPPPPMPKMRGRT